MIMLDGMCRLVMFLLLLIIYMDGWFRVVIFVLMVFVLFSVLIVVRMLFRLEFGELFVVEIVLLWVF